MDVFDPVPAVYRGACIDAIHALIGGNPLTPHFLGMALMVFVAAILHGIGGLGFAMLSAPLPALFFPELAPGPLLVLGACLSTMVVLRERTAIDFRPAGSMISGRTASNFAAVALLTSLSATMSYVLFAVVILFGVALSHSG